MCFHVHAQHSRPLEAAEAYVTLWLFLAVGFDPVRVRLHVRVQPTAVLELLSAQITHKLAGRRSGRLLADELG